ncbi:hypothetical protein EJD97_011958 [Solanum chilense]|uniref:Uncharacterized protein n=1 Tax=Solanum chilense TaxID=4083 RepID=A0A6N2BJJ0_SOLCI|nr:hypothetical protein EJD97_011958 [Solanum chilense]
MDIVLMVCFFILSVLLIIIRMHCSRRKENNSCNTNVVSTGDRLSQLPDEVIVSTEDRLSQLPDDVVVSILSQLIIREAVQTSSLSTQWQYLWMHATRLNFDVSKFITWETSFNPRLCKKEGLRHINLFNNVVRLHKSDVLEEFNLSFPFHSLLTHLEIVGPSCLKLKDLEISYCNNLDIFKIHNVNLVSFKYIGRKPNLHLQNVKSIVSADFYMVDGLVHELIPKLTTHFTQLVTLSLAFSILRTDLIPSDYSFPMFNNLKVLALKIKDMIDVCLLGVTPLIEASPYLQKLDIQLEWYKTTICKDEIVRKKYPHQHLKEVKYRDYLGGVADLMLTTYLIENSVALKTFIIDPLKCDDQKARGLARQQLQEIIPKRVKLVIL